MKPPPTFSFSDLQGTESQRKTFVSWKTAPTGLLWVLASHSLPANVFVGERLLCRNVYFVGECLCQQMSSASFNLKAPLSRLKKWTCSNRSSIELKRKVSSGKVSSENRKNFKGVLPSTREGNKSYWTELKGALFAVSMEIARTCGNFGKHWGVPNFGYKVRVFQILLLIHLLSTLKLSLLQLVSVCFESKLLLKSCRVFLSLEFEPLEIVCDVL